MTAAAKTPSSDLKLEIKRVFLAPRELVWAAWTQQEHLQHWLCPKDFTVTFIEGELKEGGRFRNGMKSPDGEEYIATGEYREIDKPNKLVFTHAWEKNEADGGPVTLVTVKFEEKGTATLVSFEQSGFNRESARDSHKEGWDESFENLGTHLISQHDVADRIITIERTFDAPCDLVWKMFTEPDHVEKWFGPEGFSTRVDIHDFMVGGKSEYVMIGPDGTEYPSEGYFLEIIPERRITTTDEFGEGHKQLDGKELPTGTIASTWFESVGDQTKVTIYMVHPTVEECNKHKELGVVPGWNSTLDCLVEYLKSLNT
jgi:uncharacterized protein YndB with AHSA1/START domain